MSATDCCPCWGTGETGPTECNEEQVCELHFHISEAIKQAETAAYERGREQGYAEARGQAVVEKKLIEQLIRYTEHTRMCILSFWEAGEPTNDGGYRARIKGKWYRTSPIDETPKCDCGLDDALAAYREAREQAVKIVENTPISEFGDSY